MIGQSHIPAPPVRRLVAPGDLERELVDRLARTATTAPSRPVAGSMARSHGRSRLRLSGRSRGVMGLMAILTMGIAVVLAVHDEGFQLEGNVQAADLSFNDIDPGGGGGTITPGTLTGDRAGDFDWDSLFAADTSEIDQSASGFIDQDFVVDFRTASGPVFDTSDPSTFTGGGSKDIDAISSWRCKEDANVTNKGDIINAYAAIYEQNGDRILYFGIEKQEGNGDNNVGLWLFQDSTVGCVEGGTGSGNAFTGAHVPGDLLLVAENTNGGGIAEIVAYEWVEDLDGNPGNGLQPGLDDVNPIATGADCLDDTTGGDPICATTNGGNITVPWPHAGAVDTVDGLGGLYEKVSFIEGGINLSEFPAFADTCFTGFLFSTRASQETTSVLFDYALGDIDTCHPELSLEKTPDDETHFVGDSFDWTIVVTNDGDGDADDALVTDTIPAGLTINSATTPAGSCTIDGQDVECTIDVAADGGTATITVNVTATSAAVTDTDGCNDLDNEATVSIEGDTDDSDDSDTGRVTVCELQVSKTATATFDRDFDWSIEKTVDPATADLFDGQTADFDYDIEVTKGDPIDSNWAVSGSITIHNPADIVANLTSVTDAISGAGSANVYCNDATSVPAGGDLVCTYTSSLPNGDDRTNTATATLTNGATFSGDADIVFGDPTNVTDNEDSVDDTIDAGDFGPFSTDTTHEYTKTYDCSNVTYTDGVGEKTIDNIAELVDDGDSDDASVTITCYRLSVSKTANTTFGRDFDWTIEKTADQTSLVLAEGQSFLVNYTVEVTPSAPDDSGYAVSGDVTIENPAPMAATITSITDTISGIGVVSVDCGGATTVPAEGELVCSYSAALPNDDNRTNDVDVVAYGVTYNADAAITFGGPTTVTDECVDVSDTLALVLGTVCVGDPPANFTFEYTYDVGHPACGEHDIPNTASFETNDNRETGSDDWNVHVSIACLDECTLTQGYWKTHSSYGPAPEDDAWLDLPDVDGDGLFEGPDETFFLSGQTWYEVFWTAPKGNAYYNLAHQYMAAVLNGVNGANTAVVNAALTSATTLFENYTPAEIAAKKGQAAPRPQFISLAGTLASYNEGAIGPGHCDEDAFSLR